MREHRARVQPITPRTTPRTREATGSESSYRADTIAPTESAAMYQERTIRADYSSGIEDTRGDDA